MAQILPAKSSDAGAISDLLEEMDRFYDEESEAREDRIRQINDALFGDPPIAYSLLAWDGDELVGFASYSYLWPAAGLTHSLFLKELYVAEKVRRTGVGQQLMRGLFDIAAKRGCSRVEWQTDQFNANAQRFYELLGVKPNPGKIFYRADTGSLLK
ncbi:GNAT family N-acetyltransferase [Fodinicola acaciae]|uniref:GNAT family N-acetyltransferase n=1 Tax=Fodinicola acaciae TaxID=2681555 RepID=UPI001C9E2629|nr:GNAT family N-acetyltransferase [Fodinicola acaciae]